MKKLMKFSEFRWDCSKNNLNESQMSDNIMHNIFHKGDFSYLSKISEYIRANKSIKLGNDGERTAKADEADAKFLDDLAKELKKCGSEDKVRDYLNSNHPKPKAGSMAKNKFDIVFPSGFHFGEIFKGEFSGHGDINITSNEETSIKETLCSIAIAINASTDDEATNNKIKGICESGTLNGVAKSDLNVIKKLTGKFGFNEFISRNYVSSAISCSKAFYKFFKINIGNYTVERQKADISKRFYNTVKDLGGPKEGDNWNPADIWLFSNEFNESKFHKTVNAIKGMDDGESDGRLLAFNRYVLQLMDMNIVLPVSLKKIEEDENGEVGHCTLMVSSDLRQMPEFEGLKPLKFSKLEYMKNAKNKDVVSGFHISFADGYKKTWNFTLWEKSNSGFTTELRDPNNSNNKSGVAKELMKKIVPNFDNLDAIYNKGKFTKLYDDAKRVLLKYNKDLKGTFDFLENPENIKDIESPLTVSNKAIYSILNSYIMIKEVIEKDNTDVIYEMYLTGLKINKGFCPHYKIY